MVIFHSYVSLPEGKDLKVAVESVDLNDVFKILNNFQDILQVCGYIYIYTIIYIGSHTMIYKEQLQRQVLQNEPFDKTNVKKSSITGDLNEESRQHQLLLVQSIAGPGRVAMGMTRRAESGLRTRFLGGCIIWGMRLEHSHNIS